MNTLITEYQSVVMPWKKLKNRVNEQSMIWERSQGENFRKKDISEGVMLSKDLNEVREEAIQRCSKVCIG